MVQATDPLASLSYSTWQKRLHWIIVVLVGLQYVVFDGIGHAFRLSLERGALQYTAGVIGHLVAGVLIFLLMIWRLLLRLERPVPPPPPAEPALARRASAAVHLAFYALLILLPPTGAAAWFLGSRTIGEIHDIGQTVLMYLVGLHVAAALVHQFWWKTGLLSRMAWVPELRRQREPGSA
jgi:cytochrome b561